jgi:dTMP kinase
MRGKFITLEGIDGAGKSTHLKWLAAFLESHGITVQLTREPGGTELGESLRKLLLDSSQRLHPETEALLVFAARREHLDKIILPALAAGRWVICDRFTDATYAYQSGGSGIAWERIGILEKWVQGELEPDITLYFDVTPEVGRNRSGRIRRPDRFEQEQEAFYQRVHEAYLKRAREHPRRIHMVDANAGIDEVQSSLAVLLRQLCNLGR